MKSKFNINKDRTWKGLLPVKRRDLYKHVGTTKSIMTDKKKDKCLPIEVENEVLDVCLNQFDVTSKEYVLKAQREQRARETYRDRSIENGYRDISIMNLEQSIMAMLIKHEKRIMALYEDSFRFKLPNNQDLARINENGTLEYKRGWKAGAQYMITLNKG